MQTGASQGCTGRRPRSHARDPRGPREFNGSSVNERRGMRNSGFHAGEPVRSKFAILGLVQSTGMRNSCVHANEPVRPRVPTDSVPPATRTSPDSVSASQAESQRHREQRSPTLLNLRASAGSGTLDQSAGEALDRQPSGRRWGRPLNCEGLQVTRPQSSRRGRRTRPGGTGKPAAVSISKLRSRSRSPMPGVCSRSLARALRHVLQVSMFHERSRQPGG